MGVCVCPCCGGVQALPPPPGDLTPDVGRLSATADEVDEDNVVELRGSIKDDFVQPAAPEPAPAAAALINIVGVVALQNTNVKK